MHVRSTMWSVKICLTSDGQASGLSFPQNPRGGDRDFDHIHSYPIQKTFRCPQIVFLMSFVCIITSLSWLPIVGVELPGYHLSIYPFDCSIKDECRRVACRSSTILFARCGSTKPCGSDHTELETYSRCCASSFACGIGTTGRNLCVKRIDMWCRCHVSKRTFCSFCVAPMGNVRSLFLILLDMPQPYFLENLCCFSTSNKTLVWNRYDTKYDRPLRFK